MHKIFLLICRKNVAKLVDNNKNLTHKCIAFNLLCIRDTTDIALHLVERYPRLAITTHAYRKSPVVALANSQVFASVGQLKFWQRWIYDR